MSVDAVIVPAMLVLGFAAGFAVGRWWALGLVVAVPLAAPLYEPDLDGAPRWFWPTVLLGPFVLLALGLGIVARRVYARSSSGRR